MSVKHDLRRRETVDQYTLSTPFELFARVDRGGLERVLKIPPRSPDQRKIRVRIGFYYIATMSRTLGTCAGVIAGFAALLTIVVFLEAMDGRSLASAASASLVPANWFFWLTTGWLYLYWLVGMLAPSTTIARRIRQLERQCSPTVGRSFSRVDAILTLQGSGALARSLVFVLSRRRYFAADLRPDVAENIVHLVYRIMLNVPPKGLDSFRGKRIGDLQRYLEFLRVMLGLVIVGRLDQLERLAAAVPSGVLVDIDEPMSAEMRAYLQPSYGRSLWSAIIGTGFPALAIVISIVTILIPG
ncbi:hypothetical protein QFZ53_001498 [Microbacterium natoriense]|uniref:Type II secretion system protein GspF domain-containing protein n=1 Tax=Microbacterium natoriense TaxID=284570 RepID=A0AAW8EVL3_9MICO|nr:hypothetical protein [Microbacterium natoriense]MDQ0647302.1 hypothetical protein [Microbacterium natoriense]